MSLTKDDVARLAALARMEINDEEVENRREELERILAYVDRLQNVDTAGIPETDAFDEQRGWREDEPIACDASTRARILNNFPDRVGDLLRVPAVFEQPKG